MQCEVSTYDELMNKVLDHEATPEEERQFYAHLEECDSCKFEYEMLTGTLKELQIETDLKAPEGFTKAVMAKLPREKQAFRWKRWMQHHPALTAAAIFMIFMAASVFTTFNQEELAVVKGQGNLEIQKADRMVIVPKGETIKGDLVVKNADVRIEGKVDGNVTVIKGNQYVASAGEVTGHSQEIEQVVEWVWYKLKSIFTTKQESMGSGYDKPLSDGFFYIVD